MSRPRALVEGLPDLAAREIAPSTPSDRVRQGMEKSVVAEITEQQLDFFDTYGFLVLKGMMTPALTEQLGTEVRRSLADNYDLSNTAAEWVTDSDGAFLPMMGPRTPVSRALVADPSIVALAEALLGPSLVPKPAKGNFYHDVSSWHSDSRDFDLHAIKLITYFEALNGPSGAFQVMPGSHRPDAFDRIAQYRDRWPFLLEPGAEDLERGRWPGQVLQTEPGDCIIFDVHLWHASLGGRNRTQWSVSYIGHLETGAGCAAAKSYIDSFVTAGHRYNTDAYPYMDPSWASGSDAGPFARGLRALEID